VLVHNFLPNVVERHGSDYESLRARNPHLIYAEITGYGSSGPLRDTPAYDSVAGAVGGLWHITGDPNGPPVRVSRAYGEST
jgi:succinate--hydroxymethylglutarate CoA-transferase